MLRQDWNLTAAEAACPDDDSAAAFVEDLLPAAQRQQMWDHLDRCVTCRRLISVLGRCPPPARAASVATRPVDSAADTLVQTDPGRLEPMLAAGQVVGRYVVDDVVGRGAMGVVYAAIDPELDRRVALKLLSADVAAPGQAPEPRQRRLLREAQALARISHPNVITVHDVGTAAGRVFVAMELIDGSTLTEWLRCSPRPLSAIVAVFIEAGRGLSAAHAAGIVHGDFKPDNVLVARDGRVCVTDFGLAHSAQPGPTAAPAANLRQGARLSQSGRGAGTPAYMAPEVHLGRPATARSDQFSFCVALYEALHGERPFSGTTTEELARAIVDGAQRAPRGRHDAPRWLARIVARGLSKAADQRYPSMDALLAGLTRRSRTRNRVAFALGAMALAVALVASLRTRPALCRGAEGHLAGVWDPTRKSKVEAAFLAAAPAYGGGAWAAVAKRLDAYAKSWTTMHTEACEATRLRGEQSDELLSVRMICLERRLGELSALVERFETADARVVERSVPAVVGLPAVEDCTYAQALLRRSRPRADAGAMREQAATRRLLEQAQALRRVGRYEDALTIVQPLGTRALALGDRLLSAEVALVRGKLLGATGDLAGAKQSLYQALSEAEQTDDKEVKADGWTELVFVTGYLEAHYEQGLQLGSLARAALEPLGRQVDRRATLLSHLGIILAATGRRKEALEQFTAARALIEKEHGPDDYRGGLLLSNEANVLSDEGRLADALSRQKRGLAIIEASLGPGHPEVGRVGANLGTTLLRLERFDAALPVFEHALAVTEEALGTEHPQVADVLLGLGSCVLAAQGDATRAAALLERALRLAERAYGADHPQVATTLNALGVVAEHAGRLDRAVALHQRALAIQERAGDQPSRELITAHVRLADALVAAGQANAALAHLERARELEDRLLAPDDPDRLETLALQGEALRRKGQLERAIPLLERAVALDAHGNAPSLEGARARFTLAQALGGTGRPGARARSLALEARAIDQRAPRWKQRDLAQISAWLAKWPP
ncbi:MAG TPA: serine/threonine-protein kinase [Polyangia bacterium]|nr:serine/threonine-protein kinase [Polyangia bacterium]